MRRAGRLDRGMPKSEHDGFVACGAMASSGLPALNFPLEGNRRQGVRMRDFEDFDATGLAALVASRAVSPGELLDAALERVAALNDRLNAVVLVEEAVARRRIAAGLPAGPLSGVPFLIKDLEAVDFPSHCGSRLLRGTRCARDAALFERLAGAGLVTFGRTTAPEGGIGVATEAVVYGGPTRNPWDPDRTPGGSSGGAGAAVAAGIVPAAQGSDGGGSVRIPASCCGLFGFKGTRAPAGRARCRRGLGRHGDRRLPDPDRARRRGAHGHRIGP
jgi:Asp-tRNA(Asn)/Glu-tRNA(Gln) amidotransferase A subunit family amidase